MFFFSQLLDFAAGAVPYADFWELVLFGVSCKIACHVRAHVSKADEAESVRFRICRIHLVDGSMRDVEIREIRTTPGGNKIYLIWDCPICMSQRVHTSEPS